MSEQENEAVHAAIEEQKQALQQAENARDAHASATRAIQLGDMYRMDLEPPNLEEAEAAYRRALEYIRDTDLAGRGLCLERIGGVAAQRVQEAIEEGQPDKDVVSLSEEAIRLFYGALELYPEERPELHAEVHHQLGDLYNAVGLYEEAVERYTEAIQHDQQHEDGLWNAARRSLDMAFPLSALGHKTKALAATKQALQIFERFADENPDDPVVAAYVGRAQELLAIMEERSG